MLAVIDIETNRAATVIWGCAVLREGESEAIWAQNAATLSKLIEGCDIFIGHNLLSFDVPLLNKLWKMQIPMERCIDTLVLSRLWSPSLEGGHSLGNWGKKLNHPKGDFTDFDGGVTLEMIDYALNDAVLTKKTYNYLTRMMDAEKFSGESINLEHAVQIAMIQQEVDGFKLDEEKTAEYLFLWEQEADIIEHELQTIFEPNVKVLKTKVKTTPFNPLSRQQVADRLIKRGWMPSLWTCPGNSKQKLSTKNKKPNSQPVINDEVLATIGKTIPDAEPLARLYMLRKRCSQLRQWLENLGEDGRVHGKVITNGAVSGRMTHSVPNMAQIPSVRKPLGKECRECWIVDDGNVLVGIDASGLELRMLAHYLDDDEFTKAVCEGNSDDGTDIHTRNMKAAGLATRDQAKTFIYAFLYGAGADKIGQIVGGGSKEGRKLIDQFLANVPSLLKLREKVGKQVGKGTIPGIDGRRLRIRSEHAALNQLLQGAGAIIMKRALIIFRKLLTQLRDCDRFKVKIVANVHDEWQVECPENLAGTVGKLGIRAIKEAGEYYGLRCPLTGGWKYGKNWAETH